MPEPSQTTKTKVAIIGATGLVGTELYRILDRGTFQVAVVGRSLEKLKKSFPDASAHLTWDDFERTSALSYSALVNLAGSSVSGSKWTDAYKEDDDRQPD